MNRRNLLKSLIALPLVPQVIKNKLAEPNLYWQRGDKRALSTDKCLGIGKLPTEMPKAGQVLQSDADGNFKWIYIEDKNV